MIHTNVSFRTTDKRLDRLYACAKDTLLSAVKNFGDRKLLTDSPSGHTATLNYSLMSAETLADYDTNVAIDSVRAFLVTPRKDGRLASALSCKDTRIYPSYETITGFSFAEEAVKLCYLVKNKNSAYSKQLYDTLCQFDAYLWKMHDQNANGSLEIFHESEAEEDVGADRFPSIIGMKNDEEHSDSPFPVESFSLMAEAYSIRATLSELALMLGKKEEATAWLEKANTVAKKIRGFLWLGGFHACFDRDYRGGILSALSINNLQLLYFGAADQPMADALVKHHLRNKEEFWTPMPLPSIARNHSLFDPQNEFCGNPRGVTYRRAIPALEKYGYYSLLTELGKKLLCATGEDALFPVTFDVLTGCPQNTDREAQYVPTASAVLEVIKRFFGVYADRETVCWGCLGPGDVSSEYRFTWGNDVYLVKAGNGVTTGSINGERVFTVTEGTRVFTDLYGGSVRVANVTDEAIDCICVCRDQTFSLHLEPNEVKALK